MSCRSSALGLIKHQQPFCWNQSDVIIKSESGSQVQHCERIHHSFNFQRWDGRDVRLSDYQNVTDTKWKRCFLASAELAAVSFLVASNGKKNILQPALMRISVL